MRTLKNLFILSNLMLSVACTAPRLGIYTVGMDRVDCIPKCSDTESYSTVTLPDGSTRYVYEDQILRIVWSLTNTGFDFELENLADRSFKIPWDDAAYVNQDGISKKVIHSGIKYEDKAKPQPPTVVPRRSKIYDGLIPSDNIVPENRNFNTWKTYHLFYDKQGNVGQQVCVVLPILFGQECVEYSFYFTISNWVDTTPAKRGLFARKAKK